MNMITRIFGMEFRNPLVLASGVAGYGKEYHEQIGLEGVGAVITKTVTRFPRTGNPVPRVCEVTGGMMNSIGLSNPGIDVFMERDLPYLEDIPARIIVSMAGDDEAIWQAAGIDEFLHPGFDVVEVLGRTLGWCGVEQ